MSFTLQQLLDIKGPGIVALNPRALVSEAVSAMEKFHVGSVIALDDGGSVCGIFTERDVLRRIVVPCRDPRTLTLRDVMTSEVRCAAPDTTIDDAMNMMTHGRYRHLPVSSGRELLGMVSIGDLVKFVANDLEQWVADLYTLVSGPSSSLPEMPVLPPIGRERLPRVKRFGA